MTIKVLFEDNHLISVIKPNGIPVQKDSSNDEDLQSLTKGYLKKKYSKPGNVFLAMVHRLDRPVGGVMVFAKTSKAASRLSDQIRKGLWKKTYIAVVDGVPEKNKGTLKDYLLKDRATNTVSVVQKGVEGSKEALLEYKVLKTEGSRSMLEIDLKTGRSHQIRVQLSSRKMPIVNDHRYNSQHERGKDIALWSNVLKIIHPVTGEKLSFEAQTPECFEKLMALRLST